MPADATHSAWAIRGQFFAAGALFATWGVQVPMVKAHHGLSEQTLALAMLAAGLGSITGLTQAGRIVGRLGPRNVALMTGLVAALAITLLLATTQYAALLLLMFTFGITASLFDVAVNVAASEIERQANRPLMSGFHGLFSLGGMAGAGLGSAMQGLGVSPTMHLLTAGVACGLLTIWGCLHMHAGRDVQSGGGMVLPRGVLGLIGVLAALGLLCEGAIYDWSVLYMHESLQATPSTAALAYASFSGAMAATRFAGDWVRAQLSSVRLVQICGALAALGMALTLMTDKPMVALLGFALIGLGLANVVPVLFSAAARVPGVAPADGIAAVAALGYLGMMAGPPLIGVVAEWHTLSSGMALVMLFAATLSLAARRALGHDR
ncbi:MFS transporter [Aquabacterium sp. CECT 9606]|uniref:MFS transporter n=1 Tax=Aquabacterium sp. CECT 9606 TaxID=2845822 RepID=UPI001E2F3875|nr:MFS transporter [Aquabacterium sp. CECT 9606]CAH0352577.1 Inner membrane protein YbjJ [Aquabacterium sp. CECT 9606]